MSTNSLLYYLKKKIDFSKSFYNLEQLNHTNLKQINMNQNQKPVYVKSHRRGCKYCGLGKTYLTCNCDQSKRDRAKYEAILTDAKGVGKRNAAMAVKVREEAKMKVVQLTGNQHRREKKLKKQPIITRIPTKQTNRKLRLQKDIYGVMWAEFLSQRRNIYYWGNGNRVTWKLPLGWNPPLKSIYS